MSTVVVAAGGRAVIGQEPVPAESAKLRGSMPIRSRAVRFGSAEPAIRQTTITAMATDPRGEVLAVAGDDFLIRILNVQTLEVEKTLRGHRDLVRSLTFDSGGDLLASAGNDGQLIVWNRGEGFDLLQKTAGSPALACVRFAPGGDSLAAVGFDDEVFLLGGRAEKRPRLHCGCTDLRAIAYRGDGQLLVVGGRSGELHFFDMKSHQLLGAEPVHQGRIRDITFHHDGSTLVSVGEDGLVGVVNAHRRQVLHRIQVAQSRLFAVALVDSQHVAVAGSDNLIRIVNTDRGEIVRTLKGHRGSIAALDSTGGFLFSGGYDATLRRWTINALGTMQQRIAEGNQGIDR